MACCIICYKINCDEGGKKHLHEKFFRLLKRHINYEGRVPPLENEMGSCQDCHGLMESFCQLYHDMKLAELQVNKKLWTISNIMKSGGKVKSRIKELRENVIERKGSEGVEECVNLIINFKNDLIDRCSVKLVGSMPKLVISKYAKTSTSKLNKEELNNLDIQVSLDAFSSPTLLLNNESLNDFSTEDVNSKILHILVTPTTISTTDQADLDAQPIIEIVQKFKDSLNPIHSKRANFEMDSRAENTPEFNLACDSDKEGESGELNEANKVFNPSGESPKVLRSVHRCSICHKTYSTKDKLESHQKEACMSGNNTKESDCNSDTTNTDDDCPVENYTEDESDCDSQLDLKSSVIFSTSKQFAEIGAENSFGGDHTDDILEGGISQPEIILPTSAYRFKCEDCEGIFPHIYSLIYHRQHSYNVNVGDGEEKAKEKTTSVEILRIKDTQTDNSTVADKVCTVNVCEDAIKRLFLCNINTCQMLFDSAEDLEKHSKLHGKFKCRFCPVWKSYAPNLAIHELDHQKIQSANLTEGEKLHCIESHLNMHLKLKFVQSLLTKCVICDMENLLYSTKMSSVVNHYKLYHNIMRQNAKRKCTKCPAYFTNNKMLSNYLSKQHQCLKRPRTDVKTEAESGSENENEEDIQTPFITVKRFKCPECPYLFYCMSDMLIHHNDHSTSVTKFKVEVFALSLTTSRKEATNSLSDVSDAEIQAVIEIISVTVEPKPNLALSHFGSTPFFSKTVWKIQNLV